MEIKTRQLIIRVKSFVIGIVPKKSKGEYSMDMSVLTNELANVGLTILCVVVGVLIVNWLDRNVFNKNKWRNKND